MSLNHAVNDGSVYLLSSLFPVVLALFALSVFQVGILVALGYLVSVLFQPVVGHYSEGKDPGRLLATGISLVTISIMSFVLATGFPCLLASVVLLRIGSSFFHPVGISAISRTYNGPGLQRAMGFQSAFGNFGVLLVFLTAAPLYLRLGWQSTFLVFATWTISDIVITLAMLRRRYRGAAKKSDEPDPPVKRQSRRLGIPLFFVGAAFISGGSYAVILNFANIFLGSRAHIAVSEANLLVSAFIATAFVGALSTGTWTRFLQRGVSLAVSFLVASVTIAVFTIFSNNILLSAAALLVNGFTISATYPLTYTELSRYLKAGGQRIGQSFGILSSAQTVGASAMGLISGYLSQLLGISFSFGTVAVLMLLGFLFTISWTRRHGLAVPSPTPPVIEVVA